MVECLTDNRNRTVSGVRHAFSKAGGNLGTDGSVSYLFDKKGVISYAAGLDEDAIMEVALESGADDIETNDDGSIDDLEAFSDDKANEYSELDDKGETNPELSPIGSEIDSDDEDYLQKFEPEYAETYIRTVHPECLTSNSLEIICAEIQA